MKRQIVGFTTAVLLVLLPTVASIAQQGAPGRAGALSARDEGGRDLQRRVAEGARQGQQAANSTAAANDADFQKFLDYIPRDKWPAALSESGYVERTGGPQREFNYQELNYPKGDKNPTSYRFDMGPSGAPVASGYVKIVKDELFTWEKGYGWSFDTPENDFVYAGYEEVLQEKLYRYGIIQNQGLRRVFEKRNREMDFPPIRNMWGEPSFYDDWLDDVSRDAVLDPDELAFKVALPNGRYLVTLIIGDVQIPRYGIDVYANGFPSDNLGGAGFDTWCRGVGGYQNPWYSHYIVNLFAQMYRKTGDERWIKPRAALVDGKTKMVDPHRGASVASSLADRKIRDRDQFIEELDLAAAVQRFRDSWPSVTSEVASTDRIAPPGLHEMYRMMLGDIHQETRA